MGCRNLISFEKKLITLLFYKLGAYLALPIIFFNDSTTLPLWVLIWVFVPVLTVVEMFCLPNPMTFWVEYVAKVITNIMLLTAIFMAQGKIEAFLALLLLFLCTLAIQIVGSFQWRGTNKRSMS